MAPIIVGQDRCHTQHCADESMSMALDSSLSLSG